MSEQNTEWKRSTDRSHEGAGRATLSSKVHGISGEAPLLRGLILGALIGTPAVVVFCQKPSIGTGSWRKWTPATPWRQSPRKRERYAELAEGIVSVKKPELHLGIGSVKEFRVAAKR